MAESRVCGNRDELAANVEDPGLSVKDETVLENESHCTSMTAINATVAEVPCVGIPLQTTYVSPNSPETAIFMYSSNTDNQGNVELHLSDVAAGDDVSEKAFTSVFAKLEQDPASYTISYQDDSNAVLQQNNIGILLGAAALPSNDNNVNNFDIFKSDIKQEPELILSPRDGSERSTDSNSNPQSVPSKDSAASSEDTNSKSPSSASSGKRIKPKASSPSVLGPQQCSICSKVFGNTSALAKHKLTHSDERKYGCVTCGKAFKRQDHLNGHMLTHRHKKPFECKADGCGKSYCDARSLRRHTENHHVHPSLPITTPTISVQEVISNTSNIPSCIHYAPKGTQQSFQKGNSASSALKLPNTVVTAATEQAIVMRKSRTGAIEQKGDLLRITTDKDCPDRLTREQIELIERIMHEQGEKLKFEQKHQKTQQQRRQSTGSAVEDGRSLTIRSADPAPNGVANSTVKLTLTSVLVQNNNIKLLLQKGDTTSQGTNTSTNTTINNKSKDPKSQADQTKPESKPVECNLCHRKFKNVPALNGHMRLHGGYFKKENDAKKWEKKEPNAPQLTTASVSVRALIEEKIIQKRSNALSGVSKLTPAAQAVLKSKLRQAEIVPPKPNPEQNDLSASKVSSFVVPAAPSQQQQPQQQQQSQPTQLHSQQQVLSAISVDTLKTNVKDENYNSSLQEETLMFNELLLKRVNQKSVKRASSDPGANIQSPQIDVSFSPDNTYLDVYPNQNGQYFTNNLTDDMFQSVRDTDSILLTDVDASTELPQIQSSDFQEISLEEYQNDLQHHQDLQAVLNSPLPVSLAEFSYMQSDNVITGGHDQTIPYSQSPLPSPSFTYPTPPASQEGQSPSFGQVPNTVVHHAQVSSPLSTAFYSSGMSSPGAVEAALNEVLPMDVNQNVYPSPPSPSPLTVTPEPSPVGLSTPTFNSQTDLYQQSRTQHDANDNLLSNQKEFEETYKFIQSERNIYEAQNYQNVILSCDTPYDPCDSAAVTLSGGCGRNVTLQTNDRENITLYAAEDGSDERGCHITFHSEEHQGDNAYDSCGDMSFRTDGHELSFQDDGKDSLFYDKDITFHMENRDITLYAHSENQGHVVLRSDDRGNMIIQERASGMSFQAEENNNYEERLTFDPGDGSHSVDNITLHIEDVTYDHQKLMFPSSLKEYEDAFATQTSPSMVTSVGNSRKRHFQDDCRHKFPQRSRLRIHRHASHMLHYTPCPMLNPLRNSSGLYWQATLAATNNHKGDEELSRGVPKNELLIESDEDPHINIGPHFQATIEPCRETPHPSKIATREDAVWQPAIRHGIMDNELDMYLEFACCAALPGGGRNKEYALHLLHLCQGNIHEAVLKLMQPKLHVATDHPLLSYEYPDSDAWNPEEIELFQQSIMKFDKNFTRIAQYVETKTTKQCVQFYYLWKKACPDEYKRYRFNWKRIRDINFDKNTCVPVIGNTNIAGEVEIMSAVDSKPFACEFPECLARFNSRAALNGHNRIHGGAADRFRVTAPSSLSCGNNTYGSDTAEEFPCRLCGKVFSKIKSRSAHMKSHRPTEMDHKKSRLELLKSTEL